MPHIITDTEYRELTAYRRLGLSPDEIAAKLDYLNDPAPMPFEAEDGITYDERGFPIAVNMDDLARAMDKEQWEK